MLASFLRPQSRNEEAESLRRKLLPTYRRLYGESHPMTLSALSDLAVLLYNKRKYLLAEPLRLQAIASFEQHLGSVHPQALSCFQTTKMQVR